LTAANRYAKNNAGSYYFDLDIKNQRVVIILNCQQNRIKEYLKSHVNPDEFEFGLA
jgi:hypothetical protein